MYFEVGGFGVGIFMLMLGFVRFFGIFKVRLVILGGKEVL